MVAITGTKGKSTTTALVDVLLPMPRRTRALRLGNFGQPPYDPDVDISHGWLVLEVSSFQCVDIDVAPGIVVVTSLGEDHLDWHGTLEDYRRDKLSLTRAARRTRTPVPDNATMHDARRPRSGARCASSRRPRADSPSSLGLLGAHSNANVALALEASRSWRTAASTTSGRE